MVQDLKQCWRGTFYARQCSNLTYVIWKDSKLMTLLSSYFNAFRNNETDTLERNFSIDGVSKKEKHCIPSKKEKHRIPAPPHAIAHNQYMGGVDRSDQLRAYFSCARKSNIWWRQLLYFLVDVSRVNAYICAKAHNHHDSRDHMAFIMTLAEELIDGYRYS